MRTWGDDVGFIPLSKRRALERITGLVSFTADYPGAIVVPAHFSNWRKYPNTPKGFVLHTPEEDADNIEVTPYYFQTPNLDASTHYYGDSDGDIYQMVEERWSPIANGVIGKPWPKWADPSYNLNSQTLNIEIEGRAATIGQTMPVGGPQFNALVRWIKHRATKYGIPLDRDHVIGHYQVANNRSDPGATFPWAALMAALQEDDMAAIQMVWNPDFQRLYVLGQKEPIWITDPAVAADLRKAYGEVKIALGWQTLRSLGAM